MHRSKTVTASCVIFALWIIGWITAIIPSEVNQHSGLWYYFGVLFFAAAIRLLALCWQTLAHAVRYANPDARMGWVIGHILLGPVISVPYYYKNKMRPILAPRRQQQAEQAGDGDAEEAV